MSIKKQNHESELEKYLRSFSFNELKVIYSSYFYSKEIELKNYNETFLEYQDNFEEMKEDDMILELCYEKTLYALNHYLDNINTKIMKHEEEIESIREKKRFEDERRNEWRKIHD